MNMEAPAGWKETTLGKIAKVKGGKRLPLGSDLTSTRTAHPYIRVRDLNGGRISSELLYVPESVFPSISRYIVNKGDVVLSIVGTIGLVAKVASKQEGANLTENCVKIVDLSGDVDTDFLFYFLLSNQGQTEIKKNTVGAVQAKLPIYGVENISLSLPEIAEQRAVVAVLRCLDDKIELLRKQNETLEQIASDVFNEWIVKKSQNGEMPDGWEIRGLSSIADFLNGIALQKYPATNPTEYLPAIKIKELNSGITEATDRVSKDVPQKYIIQDGDVLFSWSGSLDVVIWKHGQGALNQHLFKVSSTEYPKWFYYFWILHHLRDFRSVAANKATTMGHIQRHHLDQAKVIVPDNEALQAMDAAISPLFNKIIANNAQEKLLVYLRDLLLPKLMRGEIRVNI